MQSYSTSPSLPVQLNSIDKEAIKVLNDYLCNQPKMKEWKE
ncbi:MAG: hypothetical protein P4L35_08250 [Ignavibacteriaceae bacterium]|nr:hypothetical protein [Ignavibacteriaceae bacterium]